MRVPGFLLRQLYRSGSLRNELDGFSLQAHNPLGDGTLLRIGRIRVDGQDIDVQEVTARPTATRWCIGRWSVADNP